MILWGILLLFHRFVIRVLSQWKWCSSVAIAFMAFMWIR